MNAGGDEMINRPLLPDERSTASSTAASSLFFLDAEAGLDRGVPRGKDPDETDEDEETEGGGDEEKSSSQASRDGGRKLSAAAAAATSDKKPHAQVLVDHTYTDYSIVDEELLAEIDRREIVLSDAGDILALIEEVKRSVWTRDSDLLPPPSYRRVLDEAKERERWEKVDKLQKMPRGKMGGAGGNSGGVAQLFPLTVSSGFLLVRGLYDM